MNTNGLYEHEMETTVTLVLLPGLDGTEILFGPMIQALTPWVRPVVVPYPASGPAGYEDLQPRVEGRRRSGAPR